MLQLIGMSQPQDERLYLDDYVVGIEWAKQTLEVNRYWQGGSNNRFLLQVGLQPAGQLQSITIVLAAAVNLLAEGEIRLSQIWNNGFTGLPHFNPSIFPHPQGFDVVNEVVPFSISIAPTGLRIAIGEQPAPVRCLFSGHRTYFGFDEQNYLTVIETDRILPDEMRQIERTLRR